MSDTVRTVILLIVLVAGADAVASTAAAQTYATAAADQTEIAKPQDAVKSGPTESGIKNMSSPTRDPDTDCEKISPIGTYKINYFTLNTLPGKENAQVKFQFSVKYKFLDRDFSLQGRPLALYLAYTQKSLWNVGQTSMPFEESNYNPEAFLNYNINIMRGPVALRDIILGLYEHESNGLAGPQSRGWNRTYAEVRLGAFPITERCADGSTQRDHIELTMIVWHAYAYSDETAYLQSIGSNGTFLGYEGHGELNLVIRDLIVQGDWGNRLDVTSRVGGKQNVEIQYQQKIPYMNFSPYVQYWYGYDETLLRFDRFAKRTFVGVSFSY